MEPVVWKSSYSGHIEVEQGELGKLDWTGYCDPEDVSILRKITFHSIVVAAVNIKQR